MKNLFFFALVMYISFAGTAGPVSAQQYVPQQIVEALSPEKAGPMVRTLQQQNALAIVENQPIPSAFDFASVNLAVGFDDESHILNVQGMTSLRSLAMALKDPSLSNQRFQIGSHVSSDGNLTTAQRLTSLRAQAVVEHLAAFYEIEASRLIPVGYGATTPLQPGQGVGVENTRIQVINISGM
ncbi:MAG: OmpA family protein [Roseobacter sp.]